MQNVHARRARGFHGVGFLLLLLYVANRKRNHLPDPPCLTFLVRDYNPPLSFFLGEGFSGAAICQDDNLFVERRIEFRQSKDRPVSVSCVHDQKCGQTLPAQFFSKLHPGHAQNLDYSNPFEGGRLSIMIFSGHRLMREFGKINRAQLERTRHFSSDA